MNRLLDLLWPGLELAHPWLLLVALLAAPAWWLARRARGRVVFSSLAALPPRRATWRTRLAWLPDAALAAAVVALAIAAAGPRRGDKHGRIRREGVAMVMAIDTSSSMRALDLAERGREDTRLDAVKRVFRAFVLGGDGLAGRPDDAIGLVSFAGYADTRSPITLDHANLATAVDQLELVTDRREDGTAIGDGLAMAVERLRQHPARSKVIVLLTDGVQTAGELPASAALELAAEHGIKVYTVGAGTNGVAPMRVDTGFGSELVQVRVEIDETLLREVAERTGGAYFRATDLAGLEKVYAAIDRLERSQFEEERFLEYHHRYPVPLVIGMALVVLALGLRGTVLRRVP